MSVVCDNCGLQSTLDGAFHWIKRRLVCPSCMDLRHAVLNRHLLIVWCVAGILGLVRFCISPSSSEWPYLIPCLYLVCRFASTLLHEVGHAIGALLVGMRLFNVCVGAYGRTLFVPRLFGYDFAFKSIPVGGFTLATPRSRRFARSRYCFMTLCGPLMNGLLIVGAFALMLAWPKNELLVGALSVLALSNIIMLAVALWPAGHWIGGQLVGSDGLQLLTTPWTSDQAVERWNLIWLYLEGLESRERERPEDAVGWFERGLKEYPSEYYFEQGLALVHLDAGRYDQAREWFFRSIEHDPIAPDAEALLWNSIAWTDLLIATPECKLEADRLSRQAIERLPWIACVRGTRGSVLVDLGRFDEGLEMLEGALADNETDSAKALNACYIALAFIRMGKTVEAAEERLDQARKLDPKCHLLDRVRRELADAGPVDCKLSGGS
jgi:Tfp pilus assembly protein PilF